MRALLKGMLALGVFAVSATPQQTIASGHRYGRAVCIVPIIGSGKTIEDPRRPLLIPGRSAKSTLPEAISLDQLLSYTWEPSDDGKMAIVEYVVRDAATLNTILADQRAKCFERGKGDLKSVERELKKAKADFQMHRFGASGR